MVILCVPESLYPGVPVNAPVDVSNDAHDGLPDIDQVSGSLSRSVAWG